MEALMRTYPAPRLLAVLLVALTLLALLLAARQTPTPTSPPTTTLRPPAYVFVPADLPTTTTR
jgi:hypothetical protein